MRRILIVGAGQCGLLLGHGLVLAGDYEVTLLSARTPDEIRRGRPTSTQVMFNPALDIERSCGLDLWSEQTPQITGLHLTVAPPNQVERLDGYGALDNPAASTDQRLKMAGWLELLEERGGTVHTIGVTTRDLDELAASGRYDLIIVAAGRGELAALFEVDPTRSPHTAPQRALAAAYVHGLDPGPDNQASAVTLTALPGAGELILIPALSTTGPCHILFWEAVPAGPFDVFRGVTDPAEHLTRAVGLVREYTPWLNERCSRLQLTDSRATLAGRYTPTVRHPVGRLPSGGVVLGAADVTIANDPLTAQGANTATRCASAYLSAILEHGDKPFDQRWMEATFERFWADTGKQVTDWTNLMLAPPPHVLRILAAATQYQEVTARLVHGFADPNTLLDWFMNADDADRYLSDALARSTPPPVTSRGSRSRNERTVRGDDARQMSPIPGNDRITPTA